MNIAWKRLRAYSMILFILPFLCGYVSHAETGVPAGQFNFETKTVLLNSGYEMPILGLGTYSLDRETCVNSVMTLLKNGGRLIDTAFMYGNEEAVGEGVRRAMAEYGIPAGRFLSSRKSIPVSTGILKKPSIWRWKNWISAILT